MKEIRKGLLLLASTTLLLIVATEIIFRILFASDAVAVRMVKSPGRTVGQYDYDPDLGWRNRPNYDKVKKWLHGETREKINSQGLRDFEYTFKKDEDVYRIAVLGCSFTYGYAVNLEDTYPKYLEQMLRRSGRKVEVINFGTNGYGLAQMLLSYEKNVRQYNPDLVLLQYGWFNSFRAMHTFLYGTQKPGFSLQEGELVLENHPVPPSKFRWIETRLIATSYLYRFVKEKYLILTTQHMMKRRFETKKSTKMHDVSVAIFQRFKNSVAMDNIDFVAFVWGEDAPMLQRICTDAGIEFFNLDDFECPEKWGGKEATEFPPPVGHWTPVGHELVATAIFKYLNSRGT